ncbi:MAG: acyl-CoA dehydratase activase [bacterium]
MLTCGIDIGSRTIEILIFDTEAGRSLGYKISDTGSTPAETARVLFRNLTASLNLKHRELAGTVVTGYGRKSFPLPAVSITEITCHARGVSHLFPEARTVIDIGGQDSKVIGLESDGRVRDFAMNDRCAAGTGRFLEMTSELLEIPLDEMGDLALIAEKSVEINAMCAVFAESEIIGLISKGHPKSEILMGVIESVAKRIIGLTGRVGLHKNVILTGGVAKNRGVVYALKKYLGIDLIVPDEPRITGALGAALLAVDQTENHH